MALDTRLLALVTAIGNKVRDNFIANRYISTRSVSASTTLVIGDDNSAVDSTAASAINVTVPPNSSVAFPIGTVIEIAQLGAGQITMVPGSGVTLNSAGALLKTRAQYSTLSIRKTATDTWLVVGDVA